MVWLQKVSMAFVKEDYVLPKWLPSIMNGLLFLIYSLHPELMLFFSTGRKLFDKASHSLLLSKLHRYGICGQMLKYFTSYIYGRIQRVQYSGKFSDWITVKSGVPQGSILVPLLFNIHVLDLPSFVSSAIPQYADDTVLYRLIYSVQDEVSLQTDLDAIGTWNTINKLLPTSPNVWSWTSLDLIVPFPSVITWVIHVLKSLYSETPWDCAVLQSWMVPHVDEVTSKVKRLLGFIRKTVGSNDPVTMKKLFVALVRPIIEYCAPLWAPNKESHKHKLEGVQRSFILLSDLLMIPGSRLSIFPPLFPALMACRGRSRVRAAAPAGALRALFSPPSLPSSFLPHQPRGRVRVMVMVFRPTLPLMQGWLCLCVNPIFFYLENEKGILVFLAPMLYKHFPCIVFYFAKSQ